MKPATFPRFVAFEPRPGFSTCGCVRVASGRLYADLRCLECRGAGVTVPVNPLLARADLAAGAR